MGIDNNKISLAHEVVESSAKAQLIAEGHSSSSKYKYQAYASLAGHAPLRPYDPIILEGLRDNMSGVWVVISVTHIFNEGLKYTMKVHIGSTDELLSIKNNKGIKNITDISNTLTIKYPKILDEQEPLFKKRHDDPKKYEVKNLNFVHITPEVKNTAPWVRNPVKEYVDKYLPDTSGKHHNPHEVIKPEFTIGRKPPTWEVK